MFQKIIFITTAVRTSNPLRSMFGRDNKAQILWKELETRRPLTMTEKERKRMKSKVWKEFAAHDILSPRAITLSRKGANVTSGTSLHSGGELP
jgi:hypothetical protein